MCAAKVDIQQVEELVALASAEDPPTDPAACWVRDGQGSLEELDAPLVAIEAAVRIANGAVLAHAQAHIEDKKLGKALRSALHRLRSTGVEIPDIESGSSWSLGASVAQVPDPVGLIALPEPDGYFPFLLVTYGASGAIIFAGTAGAGMGYRDTEHIHVSRSRAREVLEHAARGEILHQVPFHAALHYTEKAFSQAARRPDDWSHLVDNVAPAVLNSARMLDPLMRESTERDRRILERSELLMFGQRNMYMQLPQDIQLEAVQACVEALTSKVEPDRTTRRARIRTAVNEAATAAVVDPYRATWTLAFEVATYLAMNNGWKDVQDPSWQVVLALRAGVSGQDIPFFREWAERQLAAQTESVMKMNRQGSETGQA